MGNATGRLLYTVIAIAPRSAHPSLLAGSASISWSISSPASRPAGAYGGQRAVEHPRVGQARCGHETDGGGRRRRRRTRGHVSNVFIVPYGSADPESVGPWPTPLVAVLFDTVVRTGLGSGL